MDWLNDGVVQQFLWQLLGMCALGALTTFRRASSSHTDSDRVYAINKTTINSFPSFHYIGPYSPTQIVFPIMLSRKFITNVGQCAMRANRMSTKPNFPSSTYKTTTGLVGLAVDTNARNTILQLTDTCLKSVQVRINVICLWPIFSFVSLFPIHLSLSSYRTVLWCLYGVDVDIMQRAPAHSGYRIKVEEWMHFIDKSVKMTDDVSGIDKV